MTENKLPVVRLDTTADLVDPRTDSWTAVLASAVELSRAICNTEFVPDALRGNVAATTAAIMYGREVGLPPMTALSSVHVIKGKPSMYAEALRALILAHGHDIAFDEATSARCTVRGRRRGSDTWSKPVTYSYEDAKRAGYTKNDNYSKTPTDMLIARATVRLARMMFADVIHGLTAIEELDEVDDVSAKSNGRSKVRRARPQTDDGVGGTAPTPASETGTPAPSSFQQPPLPGEPGYGDQTDGDGRDDRAETPERSGTPDPSPSTTADEDSTDAGSDTAPVAPPMASKAQLAAMHARFGDLDVRDRDYRLRITATILGREIASSNDLTVADARTVLDTLAHCKTREHVDALVDMIARRNTDDGGDQS